MTITMIKRNLCLLFLCMFFYTNPSLAQKKDSIRTGVNFSTKQIDASYKGGLGAMVLFIDQNIQLPAKKKGLKATVLINISIDSEGNITDVSVLSGINKEIDKAIIDVIKKMPKWNSATVNGNPIPSQQVIGYNISY